MGNIGNQKLKAIVADSVRDAIALANHMSRRLTCKVVVQMINDGKDAEEIKASLAKIMADSANAEKTLKTRLDMMEEAAE